jgi:2-alkenal reductase
MKVSLRLVVVAVTLVAIGLVARDYMRSAPAPEPRPVTARGELAPLERSVVELFDVAAPSVAYISTESVRPGRAFQPPAVARGAGSGFVWDERGHVVTNAHVVAGASRVQVQLDTGKPVGATVVGIAEDHDLAVVRLERSPRGLLPIRIGSSADLRIGQSVFAIGNPFGLSRTLTTGIVSALDRTLPTVDGRQVAGVIQTDAAINPGNSGGPLLDSAGRLIGVASAIISGSGTSTGVGFAIPVDLVNRIVPELIERGRAPRPGIGVLATEAAPFGGAGVIVAGVRPGSPAAKAGLVPWDEASGRVGDVIVAVDGRPVSSVADLAERLAQAGIGKRAELTVMREGDLRKIVVEVADLA